MLKTEELKELFKSKKIYVDESILTDRNFIDFINENYLWLKEENAKFYVHRGLKNLFSSSTNPYPNRNYGIAVLEVLEKKEMINFFGEETNYQPIKYIEHFVLHYLKEEIAMFSNNEKISKDIITINHFSSLESLNKIQVYRVNAYGKVGFYNNINKIGVENNYDKFKNRAIC